MSLHHGLRIVSGAIETDPYFSNTVLLLTGNGTNGGQNNTFLDDSSNNFTITRFGNTTQGSFSPFGWQWSNYFDGSGDYLALGGQTNFEFSTGDFTVELWLYLNTTSGVQLVYDGRPLSTQTTQPTIYIANGGSVRYYTGNADRITGSTLNARQWYHIAVSRSGTSTRLFIDGTQSGSTYSDSTSYTNTTGRPVIGIDGFNMNANYLNGYISSLRVLKGTAQYTSNFTPPTAPLTAITNTQLLTCQSNRFIDNSSNAFAITRNGDVRVSNFAPFPAGEYATSVEGGSGYFDGTGDYLTAGGQTAYQFGTGDFTIEFWIYFTSVSGQSNIMDFRGSAGAPAIAPVIYRLSGVIRFFTNGSDRIVGTTSVTTGQWYHIAVARSGTSTKLFLNGIQEGSTYTDSNSYDIGTNAPSIGSSFTTNYTTGYISSLRLIKGTAQYTSNFTPSTTPLTAIANTSLLLNFTNGSIVDATGKNDLETMGNAQISTSVKKYGTGSLAFDGTGDILNARYDPSVFLLSGSYTIEAWIYPTTVSGSRSIFNIATAFTSNYGELTLAQNNASVRFAIRPTTGGSVTQISGGTMTANTWYHVAVSVSNLSARLFLDGTQVGSTTTIPNFSFTPGGVGVGGNWNGYTNTSWFLGNIADLRVTKGIARYISNFTPPYRQLPTR